MSSKQDDALRLVLLFYRVGPWTAEDRKEWKRITGEESATTKNMCDHIRKILRGDGL